MNDMTKDLVLLGLGGAAARFVCETVARCKPGLRAVVFDSDASTVIPDSPIEFHLLGAARLEGRGTGGDTIKGRAAAQDDADAIVSSLKDARLVIVVVSLGGGFGSGSAPEVLRIIRDKGISTFCIATTPFAFEGDARLDAARRQLPLVEDASDAHAVIPLDVLFSTPPDATFAESFSAAASRIADVLSVFHSILSVPGFISIGIERMIAAISGSSGDCRLAVASASGPNRASLAVDELFTNGLLSRTEGVIPSGMVILGVIAGSDLRLSELTEISSTFKQHSSSADLCFGTVVDEDVSGAIKLVAFFFGGKAAVEEPDVSVDMIPEASPQVKRPSRKDKLAIGSTGSDRFKGVEGTIYEGQDLEVPTYQRRNLPLDK